MVFFSPNECFLLYICNQFVSPSGQNPVCRNPKFAREKRKMFNSYIIPRLRNRTMKIRVHDVVFLEKTLFFPVSGRDYISGLLETLSYHIYRHFLHDLLFIVYHFHSPATDIRSDSFL